MIQIYKQIYGNLNSQTNMRYPISISTETRKLDTAEHRCPGEGWVVGATAFCTTVEFNGISEAGGSGGSITSETSRTCIGARAGGCACGSMSCSRPPT